MTDQKSIFVFQTSSEYKKPDQRARKDALEKMYAEKGYKILKSSTSQRRFTPKLMSEAMFQAGSIIQICAEADWVFLMRGWERNITGRYIKEMCDAFADKIFLTFELEDGSQKTTRRGIENGKAPS